ncbi:MAG: hypothetical protein ACYCZF_09495 [Anaerolineae bacterium]
MLDTYLVGKIIRIIDTRSVIINIGLIVGVRESTNFRVYSASDDIIDPSTGENLGKIVFVKARLVAVRVYPRFTIARSLSILEEVTSGSSSELKGIPSSELNVRLHEIRPLTLDSSTEIRVGDFVEADVLVSSDTSNPDEQDNQSASPTNSQ